MYLRGRPLNYYIPSDMRESYQPQKPSSAPGAKLKLEWVYGYRGRDCRNNVHLLPTGEIVYFVASVVVLYNVEEQSQRHYLGHTDDIKCLAVHPNRMTIATGQAGGHDRKDGRSWRLNPPADPYSVEAEEWDGGGLLVAVDEAPDHNMSVWDWSKGERGFKLMETKCAADQVLSVEFSPLDRNTIITCGKNQIAFWVYENGMLAKRVGIFENRERPKYVTAISFTDNGNVISGDSNGNLLVWQRGGNRVERSVRGAHDGSIFSIFVQKDGTVITGGKDGRILEWGRDLRKTGKEMMVPEHFGAPRVVTSGKGTRLVIGTTKNCVLGGTFSLPLQPLMQDHVQAASFSKNGEIVVVAMVTGRWVVMDAETREMYSQHQDTNEPIQVVQFSPNGKFLALGSRDNNIYVYQVSEGCRKYSRIGRCQLLLHLSYSLYGYFSFYLHACILKARMRRLKYYGNTSFVSYFFVGNVNLCRQVVQPSQMRDVEWATNFCPLSFTTLGIWGDGMDGTDINSCAKANNYDILASGDDFGKIKLFAFPSSQIKARHNESAGHSSHVTCVRFLHNDTRLISVGGRDTAILQWMVTMTTTTR
ncbi:Echinoderm microtubule-associated protein-like 1 [Armadillidium nasatum]|uniref:Echinoderm microtubule-associated protein-like 1 n=1 Tax=Armadillidium nasatum TaxID=96803 RepID=A0A5N5TKB4_9CRUS|nr:Echinoderm microtubule-associated protein-like 1 [Armadillidium nasatum]